METEYTKKSMEQDDSINIREEVEKYVVQWRWFALSALVFVAIAYFYLRYTTPIYKATTTILVKDDRKGGMANELAAFSELGILSGAKSNVDNEIEIIKSRTLIKKTIKDLNLNVKYYNRFFSLIMKRIFIRKVIRTTLLRKTTKSLFYLMPMIKKSERMILGKK
jgi:tyrosine-protein kinase Etk/Wzc